MRFGPQWKIAFALAGVAFAQFGFVSSSHAIPHDGEILSCGNCGGVRFSSFHRAEANPTLSGGFNKSIQAGTPIQYEWLPDGPVGATSKQIFNRGSSHILDSSVAGIDFSVYLWVDHPGNQTGGNAGDLNVLSVRTGNEAGAPAKSGPFLGFTLTHKVSARFGFTITTADAIIFDEFIFDPTFDMGPVDSIGNNADEDVGTFLWGYTSGHNSADFFGAGSSTVCLSGELGACSSIVDALYGVNGVGLDLAYSGTRVSVSEPGALGLLAIGLAGVGAARRRRLK